VSFLALLLVFFFVFLVLFVRLLAAASTFAVDTMGARHGGSPRSSEGGGIRGKWAESDSVYREAGPKRGQLAIRAALASTLHAAAEGGCAPGPGDHFVHRRGCTERSGAGGDRGPKNLIPRCGNPMGSKYHR
jgi:hypothetical protein